LIHKREAGSLHRFSHTERKKGSNKVLEAMVLLTAFYFLCGFLLLCVILITHFISPVADSSVAVKKREGTSMTVCIMEPEVDGDE